MAGIGARSFEMSESMENECVDCLEVLLCWQLCNIDIPEPRIKEVWQGSWTWKKLGCEAWRYVRNQGYIPEVKA